MNTRLSKHIYLSRNLGRTAIFIIVVLLTMECTFTAFDFLTINLPGLGSINISDVSSIALFWIAIFHIMRYPKNCCKEDKIVIIITIWLLITGIFAVWFNTISVQDFFRYNLRYLILWPMYLIVTRLQKKEAGLLLACVASISIAVSLIHNFIILQGRADLMENLYYSLSRSKDSDLKIAELTNSIVMANWPGGGALMFGFGAACIYKILTARKYLDAVLWTLLLGLPTLGCALALSRTRLAVLFIVVPALVWLLWRPNLYKRNFMTLVFCASIALPFIAMSGIAQVSSAIGEKFGRLTGVGIDNDQSLWMRIYDTVAAFRQSSDHPLIGTGSVKLESYISYVGADAHTIALFSLLGGYPLTVLIVIFITWILAKAWRNRGNEAQAIGYVTLISYLVVLMLNVDSIMAPRTLIPFLLAAGFASMRNLGQTNENTKH